MQHTWSLWRELEGGGVVAAEGDRGESFLSPRGIVAPLLAFCAAFGMISSMNVLCSCKIDNGEWHPVNKVIYRQANTRTSSMDLSAGKSVCLSEVL